METMRRNPEEIARVIREAQTVAVISHVNPDGDTIGSAAAMRLILQALGKDVTLLCDGKVPDQLSFLPGYRQFRMPDGSEGPFDLMLAVDVSDAKRLGRGAALMEKSRHTAVIDHHDTNPLFAEVNSVDGKASATCILIHEQMKTLGVPMTKAIAVCLYTGISTDTGNFSFSLTNAEAFRVMADLMENGLPLAELNRILFREKARPQARLIGRALEKMQFRGNGKIAVIKLTKADFSDCGAKSEHVDTVVNYGMDTLGTEMALLARETDSGQIKISLRAKEPGTVHDIAEQFGGGGHPQASGITMDGTLDECVEAVLAAMEKRV